jgi:hypothetical protein
MAEGGQGRKANAGQNDGKQRKEKDLFNKHAQQGEPDSVKNAMIYFLTEVLGYLIDVPTSDIEAASTQRSDSLSDQQKRVKIVIDSTTLSLTTISQYFVYLRKYKVRLSINDCATSRVVAEDLLVPLRALNAAHWQAWISEQGDAVAPGKRLDVQYISEYIIIQRDEGKVLAVGLYLIVVFSLNALFMTHLSIMLCAELWGAEASQACFAKGS